MIVNVRIEALDETDPLSDPIVIEEEILIKRGVMMATRWEDAYTEMIGEALKILAERCSPSLCKPPTHITYWDK